MARNRLNPLSLFDCGIPVWSKKSADGKVLKEYGLFQRLVGPLRPTSPRRVGASE